MIQDSSIKVSVICITYNHEAYIRQALEGFVSQKTDFAFEVLIHDDCSPDGTAAIIREFEQKYPEIIRPVYQTVNQYSQGIDIEWSILLPMAKGEYVAFCEGDDCWTDPNKLQRQYDFLRTHPEYSACVHRAVFHDVSNETDTFVPDIEEARTYPLEEIVMEGGAIFATNSLMLRTDCYRQMPECFRTPGFGDYQQFMFAAVCGKVMCLPECMSIYNSGVAGSWSDRVWNDLDLRRKHIRTCNQMLEQVDNYYDRQFHTVFDRKIRQHEYFIHVLNDDIQAMKRAEYREFYRADRIQAAKVAIAGQLPVVLKIKRFLKGLLGK
ncbi:MAG: glycosyltransferase [Oscillospiraceae bacterium]|nr:glycosyltransferase [Oscillospiraceae bacterium]